MIHLTTKTGWIFFLNTVKKNILEQVKVATFIPTKMSFFLYTQKIKGVFSPVKPTEVLAKPRKENSLFFQHMNNNKSLSEE